MVRAVRNPHRDDIVVEVDAVADPGFTQAIVEILLVGFEALVDGRRHVDLEQDVDAATQIQAQAHRVEAQAAHPGRQPRCERQGDIEIAAVAIAQPIAGSGLRLRGFEPQHCPVVFQVRRLRLDVRALQRTDEFPQLRFGNRLAEAIGQLNRRNAAVEIGHGQQDARQQYDEHQHIEPGGILVHRNGASSLRLLRRCPWALPARRCSSGS